MLSQIHRDKSGLEKAIKLYRKAAAGSPTHRDVHWKLAEGLFKKAEATDNEDDRKILYEEALSQSRKSLELNPDSIEAHFWIGSTSAKLAEMVGTFSAIGVINEATKELKLILEMDPNHRFSIIAGAALAAIYSQAPWPMRDLEDAEAYAIEAVKKDPNLSLACATLADVYFRREKFEQAQKEAERCLSLSSPSYIWDAELYNWPSARRVLKQIENR